MAPKSSKEKETHKEIVEYEEEEEESEEEEDLKNQKQTQIRKPKENGWIDSDTESDSEPEPESESSPADYKTPLKRHHSATTSTPPPADSPTRRSIKKPKMDEVKTPTITRIWSNEDEITVLKSMYDFKNIKGKDPISDFAGFYDWLIKGKVEIDFKKEQLRGKIRSMKRRFDNAMNKCEDDSDPVYSKPHEVLAFEHAKRIWGKSRNGVKETNAKKDTLIRIVDVNENEKGEKEGDFLSKFRFLNASFDYDMKFPSLALGMKIVKDNIRFIGNEKAKELDESYKRLIADEREFNSKKASFVRNQVKK